MKLIKYGINVFDSRKKEYGGFNHFLAGKVFRWKLHYLFINITKWVGFSISNRDEDTYYDGYHNHISLGFIQICYGS